VSWGREATIVIVFIISRQSIIILTIKGIIELRIQISNDYLTKLIIVHHHKQNPVM
jgi:hypothetical protein